MLQLQHPNLWIAFLSICSPCSSLYYHSKTLFHVKNSLTEPNKWKSEEAQIWTAKRMFQRFPTKLTDGFHCFWCSTRSSRIILVKPNDNLPKKRQRHHAHFRVMSPQKSQAVQKCSILWLLLSAKMSALTVSTI